MDTCLNQDYSNAEFIIIDDCSNDGTNEVVNKYVMKDGRFKFISNSTNVGMLLNFENGLKYCTGDYIIVLGSDDGLMPNSLKLVSDLISKSGAELITWPTAAYFYSGTKDKTSQLIVPNAIGSEGERWITTESFLERQRKNLSYVSDKECPMLYVKSVASKSLVERVIKKSGGKFYSCSTPDGYSAFAFLCEVDKYLYSNKPFSLHGVSPSSAGVNYVQKVSDEADLSSKFFKHSKNRPMHHKLGSQDYSPLISIMTVDFLLTSQDVVGEGRIEHTIDYKLLIDKSLNELSDGLMDSSKIQRELHIIEKIAIEHKLHAYFNTKIAATSRNKRKTLSGDAISPNAKYFNASRLNINNVYDASILLDSTINGSTLLRFKSLYYIWNSLRYLILSKLKGKKVLKDFY
jgi:glycosyltransferase involved in cell wall biosynthesis